MLKITIHDLLLREEKRKKKKRGKNIKYDPDSRASTWKTKIKKKTMITDLKWKKNIQNITNVDYAQYVGIYTTISSRYYRTKTCNT